jgi:hypothetical protein
MDKLARKQEIVPMTAARADGELRPGHWLDIGA